MRGHFRRPSPVAAARACAESGNARSRPALPVALSVAGRRPRRAVSLSDARPCIHRGASRCTPLGTQGSQVATAALVRDDRIGTSYRGRSATPLSARRSQPRPHAPDRTAHTGMIRRSGAQIGMPSPDFPRAAFRAPAQGQPTARPQRAQRSRPRQQAHAPAAPPAGAYMSAPGTPIGPHRRAPRE
jgi:hypothetical protein